MDHFAKPSGEPAHFEHWRGRMRALASRSNVYCKWSGFAPLASSASSSDGSVRRYFYTLLDEFGTGRLMFGSDWPVCTLHSTYSEVCATTDQLLTTSVTLSEPPY